jgi:hypothetical protein
MNKILAICALALALTTGFTCSKKQEEAATPTAAPEQTQETTVNTESSSPQAAEAVSQEGTEVQENKETVTE